MTPQGTITSWSRGVALAVLAVLAVAACDGEPATSPTAASAPAGTRTAPPTEATGCGAVQKVPIQGQGHLVGDREPPVPYNSTPPTSGWHASGDVPLLIAADGEPLTEPQQVTVLELGGVVVTFSRLPEAELDALEQLLRSKFEGQVALTRYDELEPGEIALTAWGTLQRCRGLDPSAIEKFVAERAQR